MARTPVRGASWPDDVASSLSTPGRTWAIRTSCAPPTTRTAGRSSASPGDDASAADAVQEVFLRAWRAADRFDPARSSLRTWLYAIARNVVIDELRRSGSRAGATAQLAAEAGGADHGLGHGAAGSGGTGFEDAAMTAAVVTEALARLSPEHRAALVETYLRDRPYADVAAEAGIGVGTLKTRVFYGLKALRRAMDGMEVEP